MKKILAVVVWTLWLLLAGCTSLREGENRKITAWGFWAVIYGNPIGIGYWHSERGPGVESEESAKPPVPQTLVPPQ